MEEYHSFFYDIRYDRMKHNTPHSIRAAITRSQDAKKRFVYSQWNCRGESGQYNYQAVDELYGNNDFKEPDAVL